MQFLNFLFAFTLASIAYAIPQSPVGSSGGGDTGSGGQTGPGDAVGSAAASSATASRKLFSIFQPLEQMSLLMLAASQQSQRQCLLPALLPLLPQALQAPLRPNPPPAQCCHLSGSLLEDWQLSLEELRCYKRCRDKDRAPERRCCAILEELATPCCIGERSFDIVDEQNCKRTSDVRIHDPLAPGRCSDFGICKAPSPYPHPVDARVPEPHP